ncbi:hypothetical protein [Buchnera aphidicola]|uniref:hypothetical protein n=1 Tax=Buchnera aphidicola TaxID=9 RepID=UPI00346421CD
MSSISILNPTQILDIKNKIKIGENKNTKGKIKKRDLSNLTSSSLPSSESVNFKSEKKSHLYMISTINIDFNKKNTINKKKTCKNRFSNSELSKIDKYINSFIANLSNHKPVKISSKSIADTDNAVMQIANKLMDIGETTFSSSILFTKKMIHIFISRFNKLKRYKIINEEIVKQINKKEKKVSTDKNYKDKSFKYINNNNILPEKKHSINNVSLYQSKNNPFSLLNDQDQDSPAWQPLNELNSSLDVANFVNQYQENFHSLKDTGRLDKNFIYTGENSLLTVNGNKISKKSPMAMLHGFKKIIPNLKSRQLLSAYLHPGIFKQAYYEFYIKHQDLSECTQKKPTILYNVQELNNGKFKLTATNVAELMSIDKNAVSKYNILGIKASMILSKDQAPEVTYSSFIQ